MNLWYKNAAGGISCIYLLECTLPNCQLLLYPNILHINPQCYHTTLPIYLLLLQYYPTTLPTCLLLLYPTTLPIYLLLPQYYPTTLPTCLDLLLYLFTFPYLNTIQLLCLLVYSYSILSYLYPNTLSSTDFVLSILKIHLTFITLSSILHISSILNLFPLSYFLLSPLLY